jgi:hypothetical protein
VPTNTRQFIQTAGRIWYKSYRYGTNRLKGILNSVEATPVSICTLCNRVEDPSHIYSRCKNPLLSCLREATFDTQTRALNRLRTDPECPKWESSFFRKFHNRSFSHRHDRAETCWNGTLNPADLQSLLRLRTPPPVSISIAKFQEFRKRFIIVSPLKMEGNPIYELPLVLSPLLSVDVAPLPIDSKIFNLIRPSGRPLLLRLLPAKDLGVVPLYHHHHRDI